MTATTHPSQELAKFAAEADAANALAAHHRAMAEKVATEQQGIKLAVEGARLDLQQKKLLVDIEMSRNYHHHVWHLAGAIDGESAGTCMTALTTWSRLQPDCEMELILTSNGGEVVAGFALFDYLRMLSRQGHRITTVCLGMAASMAGVLLQAGDWRVMGAESWLMIHEASFQFSGKSFEAEDHMLWVSKFQERLLNILAARSDRTKAYFAKQWKRRDWWLSAPEALELGLVDEVR